MKNIITYIVIAVLVAGSASFYGGVTYEKHANASQLAQVSAQGFQRGGGAPGGGPGGTGRRGGAGGFANGEAAGGEIIAKDDTSITVKLQDGGSKIILVSPRTAIMKAVLGSTSDLMIGELVTALGTPNADGSITAQSVQIRPKNASSTK